MERRTTCHIGTVTVVPQSDTARLLVVVFAWLLFISGGG